MIVHEYWLKIATAGTGYIEIFTYYKARTCVYKSPFSVGKGSMAVWKGVVRGSRVSRSEYEGVV